MKFYLSPRICTIALVLAITGQILVELKLPALQQLYTVMSFGTLMCWVVFTVALSSWMRSDWLHDKLSKLNNNLRKSPKYENPPKKSSLRTRHSIHDQRIQ
jgi:hypothetical protein